MKKIVRKSLVLNSFLLGLCGNYIFHEYNKIYIFHLEGILEMFGQTVLWVNIFIENLP